MAAVSIGRLAELTHVKVPTIRFYEQIGLLAKPVRSEGGQRRYDADSVKRLTFIRHARDLGFDVEEVKTLIGLTRTPDTSCKAVDELARRQVAEIDLKIGQLRAMRRELMTIISDCEGANVSDCRILDAISKPQMNAQRRVKIK